MGSSSNTILWGVIGFGILIFAIVIVSVLASRKNTSSESTGTPVATSSSATGAKEEEEADDKEAEEEEEAVHVVTENEVEEVVISATAEFDEESDGDDDESAEYQPMVSGTMLEDATDVDIGHTVESAWDTTFTEVELDTGAFRAPVDDAAAMPALEAAIQSHDYESARRYFEHGRATRFTGGMRMEEVDSEDEEEGSLYRLSLPMTKDARDRVSEHESRMFPTNFHTQADTAETDRKMAELLRAQAELHPESRIPLLAMAADAETTGRLPSHRDHVGARVARRTAKMEIAQETEMGTMVAALNSRHRTAPPTDVPGFILPLEDCP